MFSHLTKLDCCSGLRTYQGIGQARIYSSLESEQLSVHSSRVSKLHISDINILRNVSCPVSPIGSPLPHSRSPQYLNGRTSPPISTPRTTSGSSTPLTGGSGAIPFGYLKQSAYFQEGFGSMPKPSNGLYVGGSSHYNNNPDILRTASRFTHLF
ncbi:mitogen-activated protein kinase kinase kinase YODA-like [Hibiscus syriacus]|uniref:mitogen-activated protein kinase kinase kinase YODA-like n=1 Tax=Hibiscus syriacus TaxID=106335 RepID=UPI001923CA78|nr:mitogen-activated protein kinase kinase kinase YODA-like [Hibiscus syriacus]